MRGKFSNDGISLKVVAGTRVVMMAWDIDDKLKKGLRGFAIERVKGGHPGWLTGLKYFDGTVNAPKVGAEYPTNEQPLQAFLWSDYEARPKTTYGFRLVAMFGDPGHLKEKAAVPFEITTEAENDGHHGVWVNRGAIASHAMATEWKNKQITPEMWNNVSDDGKLLDPEVRWLSRGLTEACLAYINDAKPGEGLRVCAYEFTYQPMLLALNRALARGVDVRIVYHYTKKEKDPNLAAIQTAGLPETATIDGAETQILFQRTRTKIPHNKFIVKLVGSEPTQVWTGSTNFTDTGFLGQTNVGHLVTDHHTAQDYLDYWTLISGDVTHVPMVKATVKLTPNPPTTIGGGDIVPFFSPRIADNMLDWYEARIRDAASLALITIPFNVAAPILAGLDQARDSLRLAILEDEPAAAVVAAERRNHGQLAFSNGAILGQDFHKNPAGGATVKPLTGVDKWFLSEELARPINNGHVFFVHSKFLVIDPLSDDPLVCSGSANFSTNSLAGNDENMLLIRGDTRVADIYLTEFDRIFRHFYARNKINNMAAQNVKDGRNPDLLDETSDWVDKNFRQGTYKNARRLMFFPPKPGKSTWADAAASDPDAFADEQARADAKKRKASKTDAPT
jgi:phosphatidylserine/phosphatidylglycerophosphate/cardiolipin synthase-like enzyme